MPEGKAAEPITGRRMHIDVMPTDGTRDEEVVRLKGLGRDPSTRIIASPNGPGWVTRADPEGNLFCVERSQEHHGRRQWSR
ncbi:VOC family protein [Micromonospora sp. AP08]|uniref:VOC family protein n=1 Tax=Micromonospora sp. AP08 TaxID=2604467 RepID=UPI002106661E|nr:VOC family protein [Micromonospora sp. AP08]